MKKLKSSDIEKSLVEASEFGQIRYDICKILDENKSENIVILNLKPQFTYDLWFIIATALSTSHLKKLCQEVIMAMRKKGIYSSYVPNEIDYGSGWVALDYGEVIVHVFLQDKRSFYELENLWKHAILENYPEK